MENDRHIVRHETSRWHDVAYWGILAAACAVMFVMNLWTSYKEDDMEFSLLSNVGVMDFLRSQYDHFMTSNGRCADLVATIFCAFLGKMAFNVCNTLVFGLMAHLVTLLSAGRRSLLVLVMFVTFVAVCYPVPGQTMLFVAGSCNYMWAITASLLLVYLLRRWQGVSLGWGKTLLLALLALIAGNFNEATSFGFLGGMVLYYIFNRRELDRNARIALVAYLLGVLIIMASPSAWNRAANGGIVIDLGFKELIASRGFIFAEKMARIVMPVAALLTGIVVLLWKGFRPIRRSLWAYVMLCMVFLMLVLGYLFDRAYAPLATVSFIIVAAAVDALLDRWLWGRWIRLLAIVLGIALSIFCFNKSLRVLHNLGTFEQDIDREILASPRHAVLHERHFVGYSRFATPLRYASLDYFNRESTYCAYYDKDNVQFVDDSVYARYHEGRLLDGAQLLPLTSDRPEIANTVLGFPDQDYMVVVLNADTLLPTPQLANYYLALPDSALNEQEKRYRSTHALTADFNPKGFFPLYYQGKHLLVFPLIDDATSHIVVQLDYDHILGEMTLRRSSPGESFIDRTDGTVKER